MKKNTLIIASILLLLVLAQGEKKEATGSCMTANCVDFNTIDGTQDMYYGGNEASMWNDFATKSNIQQYHKDVRHKYVRVWISAHWWFKYFNPGTGYLYPLRADGTYDWTNLDTMFDKVVQEGIIPMASFTHGDICGGPGERPAPFDFSGCEGFGTVEPSDNEKYAQYVEKVMQHFVDRYGQAEVNTWYVELFNEQFGFSDYNNYWTIFNLVKPRIKAIAPGAKVGGSAYGGIDAALTNVNFDFFDIHPYPGNVGGGSSTDQERMDATNNMYNKLADYKSRIGNAELISGEYNFDTGNAAYADMQRPFAGTWLISVLINEIKAGVNIEMTFDSTCDGPDGCMGLWDRGGTTFDNYAKKKIFTSIAPRGATLFVALNDKYNWEILASQTGGNRYVTVVRKKDSSATLKLGIMGSGSLTDMTTGEQFPVSNNEASIPFSSYQTRFLQAGTGGDTCDVADTDCNSCISFQELIAYANAWVNNQGPSFNDLIARANSWVERNKSVC